MAAVRLRRSWTTVLVVVPLTLGIATYALQEAEWVRDLSGPHFTTNAKSNVTIPMTFRIKNISGEPLDAEIVRRNCSCITPKVAKCSLGRGATGELEVDLRTPLEGRFDGWIVVALRSAGTAKLLDTFRLFLGCQVASERRLRITPTRVVLAAGQTGRLAIRVELRRAFSPGEETGWMRPPAGVRIHGTSVADWRLLEWRMLNDGLGVGAWEVHLNTDVVTPARPDRVTFEVSSGQAGVIDVQRD